MSCPDHPGGLLIFRRYRRVGAKVLDARQYGMKVWPIHLCPR